LDPSETFSESECQSRMLDIIRCLLDPSGILSRGFPSHKTRAVLPWILSPGTGDKFKQIRPSLKVTWMKKTGKIAVVQKNSININLRMAI